MIHRSTFNERFHVLRSWHGYPPPLGDGESNRKELRDSLRRRQRRNDGRPKEGAA